jgi:quercetin dioxygenase-like cupin family protein
MKALMLAAMAGLLFTSAAQTAPDPAALAYTPPEQVQWKSDKPDGPLYHVLWGDPDKPGAYAMLVKWLPGRMSRPHLHPHDRHILVVSGTWWVGTGKTFSPETTTPLPAGTVVTHFAKQFHYDGAKDEPVVLEIVGEGPQ